MDRWTKLISIGLVIGVALGLTFKGIIESHHTRRMALASEEILKIQGRLGSDRRFSDVEMSPYTAFGESIRIGGTVPTNGDLDALRKIVEARSLPVPIVWKVSVNSEPGTATAPATATTQ
jgi:hypothetical protein